MELSVAISFLTTLVGVQTGILLAMWAFFQVRFSWLETGMSNVKERLGRIESKLEDK